MRLRKPLAIPIGILLAQARPDIPVSRNIKQMSDIIDGWIEVHNS